MMTLEALRAADHISWLDRHFAYALGRIGNDPRPEVLLAAALVSRAVRESHVCLDLCRLAGEAVLQDAQGAVIAPQPWPALEAWLSCLRGSGLVSDGTVCTPLVLDQAGHLYLRRYWDHERRLADAIRARAVVDVSGLDASWLRAALDRLFRDNRPAAGELDWQRMAALLAARHRFCVISGGPGTGKTYTVVKILALLAELSQQRGERFPRVVLMAPTGKAAARLSESIRKAKLGLDATQAVKDAIPDTAATVHRCLGSIGGSVARFRHDAGNPLNADVVLVDEASMVDVALMARLVEAVPHQARLILLGDKDQLASVEAGAVLGDICQGGAQRSYSRALVAEVEALTGERLPLAAAAPEGSGIWDCVVQLTRSYRYDSASGIGALAQSINSGDADAVLALLDDPASVGIARVDPGADWTISEPLRAAALRGFSEYLHEDDPAAQLRLLERFRVLCAHRRGAAGVETLNRLLEEALRDAGLVDANETMYVGKPIIVRENDYQVRLFNGDVGIVAANPRQPDSRLLAFEGEQGPLRWLAPSRLPPHDTVYAMSIHKSQGSELDEVAIVLPSKPSPVLTRQLLYTAVTRARRQVTIHAERAIIRHAVERRIERTSGLGDRLWS